MIVFLQNKQILLKMAGTVATHEHILAAYWLA
jgi:hypothetical protein